jgi:hypothetical protein
VTPAERRIVERLVAAAEALIVPDGQIGRPEVWAERWAALGPAVAEARKLLNPRRTTQTKE